MKLRVVSEPGILFVEKAFLMFRLTCLITGDPCLDVLKSRNILQKGEEEEVEPEVQADDNQNEFVIDESEIKEETLEIVENHEDRNPQISRLRTIGSLR